MTAPVASTRLLSLADLYDRIIVVLGQFDGVASLLLRLLGRGRRQFSKAQPDSL